MAPPSKIVVVGCKKIEIYVIINAEKITFSVRNANIKDKIVLGCEIRVVNMYIYVIDGSNRVRNRVL